VPEIVAQADLAATSIADLKRQREPIVLDRLRRALPGSLAGTSSTDARRRTPEAC
jgi:hypothetical protein